MQQTRCDVASAAPSIVILVCYHSAGASSFACALRVRGVGKPFLLMLEEVVELRGTNELVATVLRRFHLIAGLAAAWRFFELSA